MPSNLILHRVGARRWLGTIMIAWGVCAAATAFVWNAESLVGIRFLLGVAEAGFFPGVVYFLSCWFPPEARGRAMAVFLSGIAIAIIIGGPMAGGLLELDGILGFEGWQWLFVVQGLPAVLVGIYALRAPARPPERRPLAARRGGRVARAAHRRGPRGRRRRRHARRRARPARALPDRAPTSA